MAAGSLGCTLATVSAVTGVDTAGARSLLSELYRVAVDSVDGARVLARHAAVCEGEWRFEREGRTLNLTLPAPRSDGRLRLIGIGKAAAALAEGVIASLSDRHRPDEVFLIVSEASRAQATRLMGAVSPSALTIHVGEHPLPGPASEAAGRALIQFIGTPRVEDRYIVMLSGGASALCAVPASGLTLADKQRINQALLSSGANIAEMNCVRKHLKVEPSRWYYWCDKLGLLVWQDMPSANAYQDRIDREKGVPVDKPQYKAELASMVRNNWNHPSIIMWVVFNEEQGQHDTEALAAEVKGLDPSRLVNPASSNGRNGMPFETKSGDVIDAHIYPGPYSPEPTAERAAVLGEFGGLSLPVEGHKWSPNVWGHKKAADLKALTAEYEQLLAKTWELKDKPGLSGAIYTQLTDVESEGNGLVTYDREVIKLDLERAKAANTGKPPGQP